MGKDVQKDANLTDAMREMVPDNGWKEVFAYGKKRVQWTPEALRVAFTEYLSFADSSPLPKDMKLSEKSDEELEAEVKRLRAQLRVDE